jgi:hypothetical protein
VYFDYSFTEIIASAVPIKVLITPNDSSEGRSMFNQLIVTEKSPYGFVVKQAMGTGNSPFDWLVIARRKGYEGSDPSTGSGQAPSTLQQVQGRPDEFERATGSGQASSPQASSGQVEINSTEAIAIQSSTSSENALTESSTTEDTPVKIQEKGAETASTSEAAVAEETSPSAGNIEQNDTSAALPSESPLPLSENSASEQSPSENVDGGAMIDPEPAPQN